jgi:branched-chain amino acid transport system substrate-binding protein
MTHCESAKVTNDFPKASEGFVCPTQWDETMKSSDPLLGSSADYNKAMMAGYKYKVVPYQTAGASAAILVWRDVFQRAQSLDKEKVREALTKTDLETFWGHIKFTTDGSNPGKSMVMRQIQGTKYMVVWPANVAAATLIYPRDAHY